MQKFTRQLFTNCFVLTATVFMAACGGGGISPTPVVELVTVVKSAISPETNAVAREVALATNAGATIVAANVRCITYLAAGNAPVAPGNAVPAVQSKGVLFDVSPADAEKVKPLGFKVFNASDFDPFGPERC